MKFISKITASVKTILKYAVIISAVVKALNVLTEELEKANHEKTL